jgi:fusicocca-2,10(14)-diene synthase
MALTIPEKEMDLCTQLVQPVYAALGLTNDLFSWEKERDAADRQGLSHVINAIWVLMREHSINESDAKNMCREKIKESVAEYVRIVEATSQNLEISLDLRKYIEALQYSHSGNLVWSMHCPRYNAEASYSDVQLSMMEQAATETLKIE